MEEDKEQPRHTLLLTILFAAALLLTTHLVYLFLADCTRFPVNTIKISATYEHVSRKQLESILEKYMHGSFFFLKVSQLKKELCALEWTENAEVERIWPDTLNIRLEEKKPVAVWNNALLTAAGETFNEGLKSLSETDDYLPRLKGVANQALEVLHVYKKMSKILSSYGLQAKAIEWHKNEACDLTLSNGVMLRLGKQYLFLKLERFCKAYPAVFGSRPDKLAIVDLRYPRGMAIQWK